MISTTPLNHLLSAAILCCLLLPVGLLHTHQGENHDNAGVSVESIATDTKIAPPLPISVGGPFSLIDHNGTPVTEETFSGQYLLVFFGYTNCQIMCSTSLARISAALELVGEEHPGILEQLSTLIVTVDPQHDTPEVLKKSLAEIHPALIGLTGTSEDLNNMYQNYKQLPAELKATVNGKSVVSHTSFFHLMSPEGELKTLFPPILNVESMANILKKYIKA